MSVPGSLMPWVNRQFFDDDGVPLSSGFLAFKITGEDTDKDTFTTAALSVANPNPLQLDAAGRATVFLEAGGYDIYVSDADSVLLYTLENIQDVGQTYFTESAQLLGQGEKNLTANYTVTNDDNTVTTDGASTAHTITLQAASDRAALLLTLKNQSANDWTVAPDGSETIDGSAGSYTLAAGTAAQFVPITGGWLIIGGVGL